jgi:DNA-binding NarL/FixJ family response regulator
MKKTVVLVEDDEGLRDELLVALKKAPDIKCLYAVTSAEEALDRIPRQPPDVVLMDIKLPGLSGVDCLPELKGCLPAVEVLMLTVHEDSDLIFRALKAGASGYLLKSSPPAALFDAIREVASGGSAFSSHVARKVVHYFQMEAKPPVEAGKKLSPQELTVLELIASGLINKEIADKMGVSLPTVKTYVRRIYTKLHVRSRIEAMNKHRP